MFPSPTIGGKEFRDKTRDKKIQRFKISVSYLPVMAFGTPPAMGSYQISLRLITGFSSAPSVQSWGRDPPKQKQAVRQMFADQQRHLEPYSYTATCSLRAPSLISFS
jgi:hypothetical protein